jgi:hypothetical protein
VTPPPGRAAAVTRSAWGAVPPPVVPICLNSSVIASSVCWVFYVLSIVLYYGISHIINSNLKCFLFIKTRRETLFRWEFIFVRHYSLRAYVQCSLLVVLIVGLDLGSCEASLGVDSNQLNL